MVIFTIVASLLLASATILTLDCVLGLWRDVPVELDKCYYASQERGVNDLHLARP